MRVFVGTALALVLLIAFVAAPVEGLTGNAPFYFSKTGIDQPINYINSPARVTFLFLGIFGPLIVIFFLVLVIEYLYKKVGKLDRMVKKK